MSVVIQSKMRRYKVYYKGYSADVMGFFYYGDYSSGEDSIVAFLEDLSNKDEDYNLCCGAYRFIIDTDENKQIIFDDNAGMIWTFYNANTGHFGDSITSVIQSEIKLNYNAIAQFLYYGCTYDFTTIVDGIRYLQPGKYYVKNKDQVDEYDKKLKDFCENEQTKETLTKVLDRFCHENEKECFSCTVTGGTDSRCVFSHIANKGLKSQLIITGKDVDADVCIAKEIADKTGNKIFVVGTEADFSDLSNEEMNSIGGLSEICSRYRLLKKAKQLAEKNIFIDCGGVAGEMYKNGFINQDFPFYFGKPDWKKFYKFKISGYDFPTDICGEELKKQFSEIETYVLRFLTNNHNNKRDAYLQAGYHILQCRFAPISTLQAKYITPYNPLLERDCAAYPFHESPYNLENYAFQRYHVSSFCKEIKDIPTDRGTTCDYKGRNKEGVKSLLFLSKVYFDRLLNRKTAKGDDDIRKNLVNNNNVCDAIQICKKHGILKSDAAWGNLRISVIDRLFSLGRFLKDHSIVE